MQDATYIRWFSDLGRDDVPSVSGKNASLGELYRHLKTLCAVVDLERQLERAPREAG